MFILLSSLNPAFNVDYPLHISSFGDHLVWGFVFPKIRDCLLELLLLFGGVDGNLDCWISSFFYSLILFIFINIHYKKFYPHNCPKKYLTIAYNKENRKHKSKKQKRSTSKQIGNQFPLIQLFNFIYIQRQKKEAIMYSVQNLNDCENFIQEVLQTNHFPVIQFRQKDYERYADQKTLQSQPPTNPSITKEVQSGKIQKQSTSKSKSQTCISEQLIRRGHWGEDENRKYHWFLELHYKHFICKEKRRFDKIFKTMSVFIGSREAQQCRSHHQKMQKKYHSFCNILLFLRKIHFKEEGKDGLENQLRENNIDIQDQLLSQIQLHQICSKKSKANLSTNPKQKPKQKKLEFDSLSESGEKQKNGKEIKIENEREYKLQSSFLQKNKATMIEQEQEKYNNFSLEIFQQISKEKQKQGQFECKLEDFLGEDYEHRLSFDHLII